MLRNPVRTRAATALVAGAATLALLAACASPDASDDATETPTTDELTPISVGVIPIIDVAPLNMGIADGRFADAGLDISTTNAQGGAAIVPAVVSGEFQFGYGNLISLMIAKQSGIDLQIVAVGARATDDVFDDGAGQMMVLDESIQGPEDIVGGTVGINALAGINEIAVRVSLESFGLDADSVQFVEMPIPNMGAALEQGQVDGVMAGEPFIQIIEENGGRPLPISYGQFGENIPIAAWFTTTEYAEENPDIVDAFTSALVDSLQYAHDNQDEARAAIDAYMELESGLVDRVTLPGWEPTLDIEELRPMAEYAVRYGLIEDTSTLDDLMP